MVSAGAEEPFEIVLVDYRNYKEAAQVLHGAFRNDLFSRYYFCHLEGSPQSPAHAQAIEKLRLSFLRQQVRFFLEHSDRYLVLAVREVTSQRLVAVSAWQLPLLSHLLTKNGASLRRGSTLGRAVRNLLASFGTYFRIGPLGIKKFMAVVNSVRYAEEDLLGVSADTGMLFYRLMIIGTAPECQNRGHAFALMEYMLRYIGDDYAVLMRQRRRRTTQKNVEGCIRNCDYEISHTARPPVVVEASSAGNYRYYKEHYGFSRFASILVHDAHLEEMLSRFSDADWQRYRDDIASVNGKRFLRISVMIMNRTCSKEITIAP